MISPQVLLHVIRKDVISPGSEELLNCFGRVFIKLLGSDVTRGQPKPVPSK